MKGYLSVVSESSGLITVDERVELFRDPGESQEIIARMSGKEHRLGIYDATVSRPEDGTPPVVIKPRQSYIVIRNNCNSNGVIIEPNDDGAQLQMGRAERIDDTINFSVGHHTKFRLTVEEQAREQINIEGDIDADGDISVFTGDSIDRGTHVTDSVVNRSDIGSGDGDQNARVDDSIVNRSTVGDTSETESTADDTKDRCPRHEQLYTSEVCPACEQEDTGETKFCISCGSEIAQSVSTCPDCGGELPGPSDTKFS